MRLPNMYSIAKVHKLCKKQDEKIVMIISLFPTKIKRKYPFIVEVESKK